MRSIQGQLSLMSLMDLIQWADTNNRSGTLMITDQEHEKKFYFQNGKIIYVWSERRGERIIDFLRLETSMSQQQLEAHIADSQNLGLPFISYLLSEKIISKERLEDIIRLVAQSALTDALKWGAGEFKFSGDLPGFVFNGPIKLDSLQLLMESAKEFDESRQQKPVEIDHIVEEIRKNILEGNVDLPPIPDIILQIQEKIEDSTASIDKIVDCITDQILVSKILRICNSPYYRNAATISTLKEAVVQIGLKSLQSIVTVHALSCFSPRNAAEIRKILRHSLVCAMIARQVARDMGSDSELAFMCGLLHDIGKTVMIDMLHDYLLPAEHRSRIIEDNHTEIGSLLAKKWNFSEEIQECIRYHHDHSAASINRNMVEIVYLANVMSHTSDQPGSSGELFLRMEQLNRSEMVDLDSIDMQQVNVKNLLNQVDDLDQDAMDILG